jgi:hypothetical protein
MARYDIEPSAGDPFLDCEDVTIRDDCRGREITMQRVHERAQDATVWHVDFYDYSFIGIGHCPGQAELVRQALGEWAKTNALYSPCHADSIRTGPRPMGSIVHPRKFSIASEGAKPESTLQLLTDYGS